MKAGTGTNGVLASGAMTQKIAADRTTNVNATRRSPRPPGKVERKTARSGAPSMLCAHIVSEYAANSDGGVEKARCTYACLARRGAGRHNARLVNALCAWCQKEGRPAFLGEREPFDDPGETHGICAEHRRMLLAQLPSSSFPDVALLLVVAPNET